VGIEEVFEEAAVVNRVESHPVFLALGPQQQVFKHLFEFSDKFA